MVLKLKFASPAKFYGSSLPRPRIYTDIKFSLARVDPPLPVLDPLLSWANEAHWSMGGLSFKRLRLQGRIEGHVDKLRKISKRDASSPPPAPVAAKRRRRSMVPMIDEEEMEAVKGKGLAKKLVFEFDRVAPRSRKVDVNNLNLKGNNKSKLKKKKKNKGQRSSPRLAAKL